MIGWVLESDWSNTDTTHGNVFDEIVYEYETSHTIYEVTYSFIF